MPPKRHREMTDLLHKQAMELDRSQTDVLGSYTGVPWDEDETPVQDVDDLCPLCSALAG